MSMNDMARQPISVTREFNLQTACYLYLSPFRSSFNSIQSDYTANALGKLSHHLRLEFYRRTENDHYKSIQLIPKPVE